MTDELTFPYRASPRQMALAVLIFGACAAMFIYLARTNTRGLIIDRVITFRPDEATLFYAVLAVLAVMFVMVGLIAGLHGWRSKSVLSLGRSEIVLPGGPFGREAIIPYADITSIQLQNVQSRQFLVIKAGNGKRATIMASMLPSNDAFARVQSELAIRTPAAPAGQAAQRPRPASV
jgi:preprotein translocase subunit SecE